MGSADEVQSELLFDCICLIRDDIRLVVFSFRDLSRQDTPESCSSPLLFFLEDLAGRFFLLTTSGPVVDSAMSASPFRARSNISHDIASSGVRFFKALASLRRRTPPLTTFEALTRGTGFSNASFSKLGKMRWFLSGR